MKQLAFLSLLALATFLSDCRSREQGSLTVNPVIGDASFISKYGHAPDAATDNDLRIKTHLEYVEQLLRQKDASALPAKLQASRSHMLHLLSVYRQSGRFPKNYDYPGERKPCFIDAHGAICAVGYLVEQTAGRTAAESINNRHQYDELLAMTDQDISDWVATSGLSKEECAMIQPTYGYYPPPEHDNTIKPGYAAGTAVLAGCNLAFNAIHGIQMARGVRANTTPVMGLFTGAGQVILGAIMMPREQTDYLGNKYINEKQKTVSMVNISLGSASMVLSAWNIFSGNKPKEKRTTWNMYSFPTLGKSTGIAFSVTRKF